MPPRKRQSQLRFVEEARNWTGTLYRIYEAPDGTGISVCVRRGWRGQREFTNAQAKTEALSELRKIRERARMMRGH